MRSLKAEVVINVPAPTAWEMLMDNQIIGKIKPEFVSGAEYLQGDGSPGSVRQFILGSGLKGRLKESKGKIEKVEKGRLVSRLKESKGKIEKVEKGRLVSFRMIDDDLKNMYDQYTITYTFLPVPGCEEKCKVEWNADYVPLNSHVPAPVEAKDASLGFLRAFEKLHLSLQTST